MLSTKVRMFWTVVVLQPQFIHLVLKDMLKSSAEHCLVPMNSSVHQELSSSFMDKLMGLGVT